MEDFDQWLKMATQAIQQCETLAELQALRVLYLGKKGVLSEALKQLSAVSAEMRPARGQIIHAAKSVIQAGLDEKNSLLEAVEQARGLAAETCDVTLIGRNTTVGGLHPITLAMDRVVDWFSRMGFIVHEGPEIETDYYNFEALNFPHNHPARAMHDTFYLLDQTLLRTHTSPVQMRVMETQLPPLRIIAPGRVYRCDSDATHSPMFHQVEVLWIDETVTFSSLKALVTDFLHAFFEADLAVRFRPSFFPFTEPSAEVDIACVFCAGKGCRSCGHTGWLEVLGCGVVHPAVLAAGKVDSERFTGIAIGMGVERLAMLRYRVPDLRFFFENDLRFLRAFHTAAS